MTTYLANLDFDDRLAGKGGGAQPRPGPPDGNAVLWRIIAQTGDTILVPGLREPVDLSECGPLAAVHLRSPRMSGEPDFVPWGYDELARRLAGNRLPQSVVAATRLLNDRQFAWSLEAMPGSFWTSDVDRILDLAAAGMRVILKPRHGGFGRGLRRVLGPESDANLVGWVRARCREGGVVIEPLIERFEVQWGSHWEMNRLSDGSVRCDFLGQTALECDEHGQFVGSVWESEGVFQGQMKRLPDPILESGYKGPISIDGCRCLVGGELFVGQLRDVNARWSVGRLVWQAGQTLGRSVAVRRIGPRDKTECLKGCGWTVIPPLSEGARPRWSIRLGDW